MQKIEQGDIIRIDRSRHSFLVVSSDYFNTSGAVIVCPVVRSAPQDALHVPIRTERTEGVVLCEELATVSSRSRSVVPVDRLSSDGLINIIYRVQSIFDYYQHAE